MNQGMFKSEGGSCSRNIHVHCKGIVERDQVVVNVVFDVVGTGVVDIARHVVVVVFDSNMSLFADQSTSLQVHQHVGAFPKKASSVVELLE